jgi:hypothetical protein
MSQPSENPDHYVLKSNYNLQVQKAFRDIITFLSGFGNKIRGFKIKEKFARMMVTAAINTRDNYISGDVCSEIRDDEETPPTDKVDKLSIVEQVNSTLVKCHNLCEDASHEVIRRGECGDKIQEMKKEFAAMIEIAKKLRSRGEIA